MKFSLKSGHYDIHSITLDRSNFKLTFALSNSKRKKRRKEKKTLFSQIENL